MEHPFIEDKIFDKVNFTITPLSKGEYEHCTFINCDFSNSHLGDTQFSSCEFNGCNLSLAKLNKTAFRDVRFKECKMLGLQFELCNPFGFAIHVDHCNLNHSSFYQTKLKKIVFKNSELKEVDFSGCDLTGAIFDSCDLTLATFNSTVLEKADFRTSSHYSINPEINSIKKAKFSFPGIIGLLDRYDIEIDNGS